MTGGPPHERLISVLAREVAVPSVSHLISALKREEPARASFCDWAIGFDSNVLLNLAKGRRATDVPDYLSGIHRGPLILPAQVVQEFWNNRLSAVSGLSDQVREKFLELERLVQQIDPSFRDFSDALAQVLDDFRAKFGHVLDDKTTREIVVMLDILGRQAVHAECPRAPLAEVASFRKRAKTPPGFKDDGDGDFLVWADFLLGLVIARDGGAEFPAVALVTDDVKKDWSTKGTTSPILQAEVEALLNVPFTTLTLAQFTELVRTETSRPTTTSHCEGVAGSVDSLVGDGEEGAQGVAVAGEPEGEAEAPQPPP